MVEEVSVLGYMAVYYGYILKLLSYYTACSKSFKSDTVVFFFKWNRRYITEILDSRIKINVYFN